MWRLHSRQNFIEKCRFSALSRNARFPCYRLVFLSRFLCYRSQLVEAFNCSSPGTASILPDCSSTGLSRCSRTCRSTVFFFRGVCADLAIFVLKTSKVSRWCG
ncbi:unnamed protein product [Ixodes pacificus]